MSASIALAASTRLPAPAPEEANASARVRIERRMEMLARLAEIGMEIAEACGRDARAMAAAPEDGAATSPDNRRDPGLVFARVARAVRMTIALESRLAEDLADLDKAYERAERERKADRRIHLSRLVGKAARETVEARRAAMTEAQAWNASSNEAVIEAEIDRLADKAYERLTEAEDGYFEGLSFEEAVAAICKDLGLSPDWTARLRRAVQRPGSGSDLDPPGRSPEPDRPPDPSSLDGAAGPFRVVGAAPPPMIRPP